MNHEYFNIPTENFETFDFSKLEIKELEKAIHLALRKSKENIKKIVDSTEAPTFQNTLLPLETSDEDLDTVLSVLYSLFSAETNDEIQNLVEKISPLLSNHSNEILLNSILFSRVKSVYETEFNNEHLNAEQKMLLKKCYNSFVKNGANLSDKDKDSLTQLDSKISVLSPQFSKNSLNAINEFEWTTTDKNDLKGMPESYLKAAESDAELKNLPKGTYLFTLHYPSLSPILKYNSIRSVRELFYMKNSKKSVLGKNSNQKTILELINLRDKKAKLLGFKNYAAFVLEDRMAKSPSEVFTFLDDLKKYSLEPAKKELEEVKSFAKEMDGLTDFKPWDFSYYSEKLKEKKYKISEEETKPYFPLEKVLDGAFTHAQKLYGVTFKENSKISKYHEEVRTFEVWEEESFIGVFYTDFFPRASKKPGAWCTHFRPQGLFKDEIKRPHVSIVCNFTKPSGETPALLTYNEVRTLFHEFGHALHDLLSQCTYRSLSGTSVYWDFVELPSQIMENWTLEKESLKLFAHHYKTGEVIPSNLIEKLKAAQSFQAGLGCLRQLRFAYLDMLWHTTDPQNIQDVLSFEEEATKDLTLIETPQGSSSSCSFGHIFAGGYAAGYYSYKWAEVLDADAFEFFQEKGIFNPEVTQLFKTNILEKGGTEHPEDLYFKFRGKKPDVKALLRRDNLLKES